MRPKRRAGWKSICLILSLGFAISRSHAQEPVAIENPDLWNHYIRPLRMIHSQDLEARRFGSGVTVAVIVSVGGEVESAHAVDGPAKFFSIAESIERDRLFKPFEQDGVPVRALIKDWVQIVPPEQWADRKVPFPDIKNLSTLRMSLTRTVCYGSCPSYSVEIRGDGQVVYRGDRDVLITGQHHARVSAERVRNLLEAFRSADYFSLRDDYSQRVTDTPTYTTAIEFDGYKKSVGDHVGSGAGMPEVVTELEDKIDELAETEKWLNETSQTWPSLVSEHWDFRADTEENRSLFASVAAGGSPELIDAFLAAGAPALTLDGDGASPVVNAAENGNLDLVRRMVGNGSEVPPELLFRSLRAAAHSGNVNLIEFLLAQGANVNARSSNPDDRESVLIGAASRCQKDAVQELLRYHPEIDAQDYNGNSALARMLESCALSTADVDGMFELLVSAGANVNLKNHQGQTPLFSACFNPRAVSLLVAAGADLNVQDKNRQTALMHCVTPQFAKAMIAAGADLFLRDDQGETAVESAREMGLQEKADLLQAAMKTPPKLPH
jgi:ankyrin repeat protein